MFADYVQPALFDVEVAEPIQKISVSITLTDEQISKFKSYTLQDYINDIESDGLSHTWSLICEYVLTYGENIDFLNTKNFGEMYEIGLAIQDKIQKKNNGQYYTPEDVALIMSEWFDSLDGENVCDVACGTGKLILTYLNLIGRERAVQLLQSGKLYLYDVDAVALNICVTSILLKYGTDLKDRIHAVAGDFLSSKIKLPKKCRVISNPPYAAIQYVGIDWQETSVLNDSRELYSVFMEKIIKQSVSSVIITPYSFISGAKFYSLRQVLNQCNGEIYSFDNVPGNIFFEGNTEFLIRIRVILSVRQLQWFVPTTPMALDLLHSFASKQPSEKNCYNAKCSKVSCPQKDKKFPVLLLRITNASKNFSHYMIASPKKPNIIRFLSLFQRMANTRFLLQVHVAILQAHFPV